jgi:hypothetical protein
MKKVHGIAVDEITYKEPGNGLPKWVKEQAATRGYGDSLDPITLFVTEDDINAAFDCAAQGNGSQCVMAQAGQRLGAKVVYFYRTTAWIDFGTGPILRFRTANAIYRNVIEPFDRGDRDAVEGGVYHLMPPRDSSSLKRRRQYEKSNRKNPNPSPKRNPVAHTERVVMAASQSS